MNKQHKLPLTAENGLWIFGYGSLIWRPEFDHEKCVAAKVHGWHRRFSLHSTQAWGSADLPGLSLAIFPGGSLIGAAYHVLEHQIDAAITYLDKREADYIRRTINIKFSAEHKAEARTVEAMTYVYNPQNARFRPGLTIEDQARLIWQGVGWKGSSRSYLENTVNFLDQQKQTAEKTAHGSMHRLLKAVERLDQR